MPRNLISLTMASIAAISSVAAHGQATTLKATDYKPLYLAPTSSHYAWTEAPFEQEKQDAIARANRFFNYPGASDSYSMPNFFWQNAFDTYILDRSKINFIAHRGRVNLNKGIAENTIDAVQNAFQSGIYFIEIDVQASSNGTPMAAHDDTLNRLLGDKDRRVIGSTNSGDITKLYIRDNPSVLGQNPDGTFAKSGGGFFCSLGDKMVTLGQLIDFTEGFSLDARVDGANGRCLKTNAITWFLDPKNFKSAAAAARYVDMAESSLGKEKPKEKFYIKTYDEFYDPLQTNPDLADRSKGAARLKASLNTIADLKRIKIMPVINVRKLLDAGNQAEALVQALKVMKAYSDAGFQVAAVEFPGAWDQAWVEFVRTFYDRIVAYPNVYFKNNPEFMISGVSSRLAPTLSYGYRFPDFRINGKSYDWDMNGRSYKEDTKLERQKLGSAAVWAGFMCHNGYGLRWMGGVPFSQRGCFVTHDYPHQEAIQNRSSNMTYSSSYVGAPQTTMGSLYPVPKNPVY